MENDSIRSSGGNTLVDVWIDGKLRGISVSRGAIETFLALPPHRAAAMSEDERCEFVRIHLPLVLTAAKAQLRQVNPAAESVAIDAGQLGGRGVNRRKTERRKPQRPDAPRVPGDRRRGDRRKTPRRKPSSDRGDS
jgi:hypothetical protein